MVVTVLLWAWLACMALGFIALNSRRDQIADDDRMIYVVQFISFASNITALLVALSFR